jgi:hypothetical protein
MDPHAPPRPTAAAALLCLLCLGAAVGLSFLAGAFQVDDAFISYRYAQNLAHGAGLVFNPGDRLEGYTNFLWVLLLAGVGRLGLPIPGTAVALGFLLGLAGLGATWLLARAVLGREDLLRPLLPVLALALNRSYWLWAVSGLENPLYGALLTLGAALVAGARAGDRRTVALGAAAFALATLARPEAPLAFLVCLAVAAVPPRPALRPRELALPLAVFAVPLALYAAWKLSYFGELLPNTFYAKNVGAASLARPGGRYVLGFVADYGFGAGGAALLAAPLLAPPARRRVAALPAALTAAYLAYVWAVGGDIYYHYRFLTPVLPFLCVGVASAAIVAADRLPRVDPRRATALAAAVLVAFAALADARTETRYRESWLKDRDLNAYRERVAAWLRATLPASGVIATISAGIIPYRTGLRTVDLVGLTNREIARSAVDPAALGPLAHQKSSAETVLRERPDFIEFRHFRDPALAAAGEPRYLDFAELYDPFFRNPPRYPAYRDLALREAFHRSYRLVLFPMGGGSGIATFRRFPDGAIPDAEAWSNHGWALQAEGFGREGQEALLRALRASPGDPEIRRRLEAMAENPSPGASAAVIRAALAVGRGESRGQ